jgi:hypothetical protein
MQKIKLPNFLEFWHVDEIIECLSISVETRMSLLQAMPDAYSARTTPGEDSFPEPDRDSGQMVKVIWDDLAAEVQQDILNAYRKERAA